MLAGLSSVIGKTHYTIGSGLAVSAKNLITALAGGAFIAAVACSGAVARDPADRTATAVARASPSVPPATPTSVPVVLPTATAAATVKPTVPVATPTRVPTATARPAITPTASPAVQPTAIASPAATPAASPAPTETPDPSGLFLEVTGLGEENVVRGRMVFITGRVSPDAVVSVNGVIIPVEAGGSFGVGLALNPGPNLVEIVASNLSGITENREITIISIQEDQ